MERVRVRLIRARVAGSLAATVLAGSAVGAPQARSSAERLHPDKGVERPLAAGETHDFLLRVCGGCLLRAELEQKGVDAVLELGAPGGETVTAVDTPSGRFGRESLLAPASLPGDRRLTVRGAAGGGRGRYRLTASALSERAFAEADRSGPGRDALEATAAAAASYYQGASTARAAAITRLSAALGAWRAAAQPRGAAEALALLAELLREQGEPETARQRLEEALPLWRRSGDSHGEARCLGSLGHLALARGESQAALELYALALDLHRRLGDRHGEAQVLNNQGHAQLSRGAPRDALEPLQAAIEAAREADAPALRAAALQNLAGALQVLGRPAVALPRLAEARDLHRAAGQPVPEGRALVNIGSLHRALGDHPRALEAFLAALSVFRLAGNASGEATARNNLGAIYLSLGEPERAGEHLAASLPLRRSAADRRGEAASLHNLGRVHQALGQPAEAEALLRQALALRRELSDRRGEATTLAFLGALDFEEGRFPQAARTLGAALELSRRVGDPRLTARLLRHLGEVASAQGLDEKAEERLREALDLHRRQGEPLQEVEALRALAAHRRRAGDLAAAGASAQQALALLESNGALLPEPDLASSFFALHRPVYELAVDVAMDRHRRDGEGGHGAHALELSERVRARGLRALLAEARVDVYRGLEPDLADRRQQVLARLADRAAARRDALDRGRSPEERAAIDDEISGLLAELDAVETRIRIRHPDPALLRVPDPSTRGDILDLVGGDTVLLEYFLGREASYLWAVADGEITAHELPRRGTIEAAVKRLHLAWSRPAAGQLPASERALAREVSELLLGPVARRLDGRRLAVVPDGALHYLPLAALSLPQAADPDGAAEPLLLSHEVVVLPSVSALLARRRAPVRLLPEGQLAVLADPVFDPADPRLGPAAGPAGEGAAGAGEALWPRLPWSRQEAQAAAAGLPAHARLLATGFDASRELAVSGRLAGYRRLHFATHALADDLHPRLSGLALSMVDRQGRPEDGFLSLQALYELELNADLVVLSACRTALGREIRGEGLMGLARAFLAAGSRRVVASLWPVQDRATAELMEHFYRELLEHRRPAAEALRRAQLELRRGQRWRHPNHWAGFVLIGDWEEEP